MVSTVLVVGVQYSVLSLFVCTTNTETANENGRRQQRDKEIIIACVLLANQKWMVAGSLTISNLLIGNDLYMYYKCKFICLHLPLNDIYYFGRLLNEHAT